MKEIKPKIDTSVAQQVAETCEYPVRYIQIATCGKLYAEWKLKKRLYKKAAPEGLLINVEYADTKYMEKDMGEESTAPVVLVLHGAPGSHREYTHLIQFLYQRGYRVIVPNFPNYALTEETGIYRHSAAEKKEFVKDFLKAIGVKKIDLLVSHSSAIYPTCLVWRDEECPPIGSIAFINPSGHRRIKAMRPKIVTSVFVRVYQNKYGRILVRAFGTTVLGVTGCPVRPDNMDTVILSATTMVYSKFRYLTESLDMLREKKVPLLMVISENDKLVDTEISYEMANILGAEIESFAVFNESGLLAKGPEGAETEKPWVLVLPEGGHYSFVKHPKVVNEAVGQFLETIVKPAPAAC